MAKKATKNLKKAAHDLESAAQHYKKAAKQEKKVISRKPLGMQTRVRSKLMLQSVTL